MDIRPNSMGTMQVLDPEEPDGYDNGIVCENGHVINDHAIGHRQYNARFCSQCGAKAVEACGCGQPVRGNPFRVSGAYSPPAFCAACGKPFVWTERKQKELKKLLEELVEIEADERAKLEESIPDILRDTPQTQVAVTRFKKLLQKLPEYSKSALIGLLKEVATTGVCKLLGLN